MKKYDTTLDHLHSASLRIAKFHFVYVGLFVAQTIIFHATKVITPELLLQRWVAVAALAIITVVVWLSARTRSASITSYRTLISIVIVADIAFAAFNVFTQRGYASKSVFLFIIPIIVAAALLNRTALYSAAVLSVIAYTTAVIVYFVANFNEGYMSEMYAEIGLYSGLFIGIAYLLWAAMPKHK